MVKWLKENWFKVGILLAVLVTTFTAGFYFMIYLPEKDRAKAERERGEAMVEQQEEQRLRLLDARAKKISEYRQSCLNMARKNEKSREETIEFASLACNRNVDPTSCMQTFIETELVKLPTGGEDFVQACTNNMIKKYGTD